MGTSVDVVVAGLGVLGAAAARFLAGRGLSVLGLDRHRPPHELGSSHGDTRIIRRVYAEGAAYVPLLRRAYELWRELGRASDSELLLERGGLFLGRPGSALLEGALACARECRLEHELLTAGQVRRRFQGIEPPPEVEAVFDPAAGVLRAERCVEALLAGAAQAGAELRYDCPLEGWRTEGAGIELFCGGASMRAGHLVLACGGWLSELVADGLAPLAVERQVQHWFAPRAGMAPADGVPALVWELTPERTWYALPDLGEGLKAAFHRGGEQATADTVRRQVDAAEAEAVRRLLERFLPAAAGPCRASRVCLYANTPDLRFLAGPLPGEPRVWLLGGGSGHGFKFAPALGELTAAGIAEGGPPPALAGFAPSRFAAGRR